EVAHHGAAVAAAERHVAAAGQRAAQAARGHVGDGEVVALERDVRGDVVDDADAAGGDVAGDAGVGPVIADDDHALAGASQRRLTEAPQPDVEVLALGLDPEVEGVLEGVGDAVDGGGGLAGGDADVAHVDAVEVVLGGDGAAAIEGERAQGHVGEV